MRKIAFIIPGFGCPKENLEYQEIAKFFKRSKFNPVLVDINWKRKTHDDYVEQFKQQYLKNVTSGDEVCVLGFSFGAMTAAIAAPELKPTVQILCSLSPFFKEDLVYVKRWWLNYHGIRRCSVFEKLSCNEITGKTKCKTIIIAGNKEGIEVERRAKEANKKMKNSQLFFLDGVRHDISDKIYLEKIKEVINDL